MAILDGKNDVVRKSVPWPEAQARIDEIVSALRQWKAEDNRIEVSFKLPEIEAEIETLCDQETELFEAILARPAISLAGIMVKAHTIKTIHGAEELIELGDTTDEMLAASLINDLLAGSVSA